MITCSFHTITCSTFAKLYKLFNELFLCFLSFYILFLIFFYFFFYVRAFFACILQYIHHTYKCMNYYYFFLYINRFPSKGGFFFLPTPIPYTSLLLVYNETVKCFKNVRKSSVLFVNYYSYLFTFR